MSADDTKVFHSDLPGLFGWLDVSISKLEAVILAAGVLLMAFNTCINVVSRFAFGHSLFFSGEVNRILIVMITFAGLGYAARHGRHIRMSALYDVLPVPARKGLMIFITLITAAVMFFLCYYSVIYLMSLHEKGRVLPALRIPVWTIYLWVPAGFFITAIQYTLTGIKNLLSPEIHLSTQVTDGYNSNDN